MAVIKAGRRLSGIHPKYNKNTSEAPSKVLPLPLTVSISMRQHIGAECEPLVEKGDLVTVGQLIGDCNGGLYAPVHSSVSGEVIGIKTYIEASGVKTRAVTIETDKRQTVCPDIKPPVVTTREELIKAAFDCGLSGLGGAGFPTHAKLALKDGQKIDTLIINGAECEPYITSDYREMMESADDIAKGIIAVKKLISAQKAFIGIEDNKLSAIKLMDAKSGGEYDVVSLPAVYPQGAEKVLIYTACKRVVPEGKLPADIGVLVLNVTTIAMLWRYMQTGIPLINRRVTVDGDFVKSPKNLIVPIGTSIADVLSECGADLQSIRKILTGGPMMGTAVYDLDTPVIKTTNSVICFGKEKAASPRTTACIRCGRCIFVCPVGLMPINLEKAYDMGDTAGLEALKLNLCINCGCCSYVCPSKRRLTPKFQLAKKAAANTNSSLKPC